MRSLKGSVLSNQFLCSGCGLCAAVCPRQKLNMGFNPSGELVPGAVGGSCSDECGLCVTVCPFNPSLKATLQISEQLFQQTDGILWDEDAGYWLGCYSGYSEKHRLTSASGGVLTHILQELLHLQEVDRVITVAAVKNRDRLFDFTICTSAKQVAECSGSVYYPVEASKVIQHVLSNPGVRYAIVALPCLAKALRHAMESNPKLRVRIKFILGLVCGQQKSRGFVEYLCARTGGDLKSLEAARFRVKLQRTSASDLVMETTCHDERDRKRIRQMRFSEGIHTIWDRRFFSLPSCDFCDDTFVELADAAFMDAWLPDFIPEWRGHSLVLVRNPRLQQILKTMELNLQPIGINYVVKSQTPSIIWKRKMIQQRIRLGHKAGLTIPILRLSSAELSLAERIVASAKWRISRSSSQRWVKCNGLVDSFHRSFAIQEFLLSQPARLRHVARRIFEKVLKIINSK